MKSTPDTTPFTDAPIDLLCLWNQYALRGLLDSRNPPATIRALQLKRMRETAEAICTDLRLLEADMLASQGPPPAATCARCGAGSLTRYVTARETGATYCPESVERLERHGQAGAEELSESG